MTPDEIRDLNRKMFETFKPKNIDPETFKYDELYLDANGDTYVRRWSPATSVDDALALSPEGCVVQMGTGKSAAWATAFYGQIPHHHTAETLAAAICLALLDWKEKHGKESK